MAPTRSYKFQIAEWQYRHRMATLTDRFSTAAVLIAWMVVLAVWQHRELGRTSQPDCGVDGMPI